MRVTATVYGFSSFVIFISSTCIQWPNHPPQYINTLFSSVTWQIIVSTCSESFQKFLMFQVFPWFQFVLHHALSCFTDAQLPTWLWPQTLLTGLDFGLYPGLLWPVFGSFTLWIIKPSEGTSLWPQDIFLMSLWSQSLVPNFTGYNMMFIFQMMGSSTCIMLERL